MRRLTCIFAALLLTACHAPADDGVAVRLGSPDPTVARKAIEDATKQCPDAIPELRAILRGDDKLAAQYAAVALGRISAPGAEYALLESLRIRSGREDPYLIQFASEALAARGKDALPVLRRALALDRPAGQVDDKEMWSYSVGDWVGALPAEMVMSVMRDVVARHVGNSTSLAGGFLLDQGESGMRMWAENFLRDEPLPTVSKANVAWRSPLDRWDNLPEDAQRTLEHGSLKGVIHPDPYQIAIDEGDPDYLMDLAWEYARSERPEERLWGFAHLLKLIPGKFSEETEGRAPVIEAILTDPHWRMPLLLWSNDSLDVHGEEPEEMRDALRACMAKEGEAAAVLAAATLLRIGDAQAVKFATERLPEAAPMTAQVLARGIWYAEGLSDEQRMALLEPLLERARGDRADYVMAALGEMPQRAWPQIATLLNGPDEELRVEAAWALAEVGSEEAVPTLEEVLEDRSADVRREALEALGVILESDVEVYLKPFLASDDADDRQAAFQAAYRAGRAELMARVFRRIPADCRVVGDGSLTSQFWGPNGVDRRYRRHRRSGSEAEPASPPDPSPPVLQEAAREVLEDESRSEQGRWNAASLIVWDVFERRASQSNEGTDQTAEDVALINGDLWPVVEVILRYPEFYDGAQRVGQVRIGQRHLSHVEGAVRHARRDEAVPLLAAGATRGMDEYPRPDNSIAVETLTQIEPEGVQWLIQQVSEGRSYTIASDAARALGEAGVEDVIPSIIQRAHVDWRHGWLDVLGHFEGDAGTDAIREIVLSLPLEKLTDDDMLALMRADIAAAQEIAREVLSRSRDWRLRNTAANAFVWQAAPETRGLLLRVAGDDAELYDTRYGALRAVEKFDPELARDIAEQWTHDHRFRMRSLGRDVLRGPERRYY
ncbi:MAG: HEAT repeat domain-containing protein [Armatimonadota bacterium]